MRTILLPLALAMVASAFSQNREFLRTYDGNWPKEVIEPHPKDQHMADYLMTTTDSINLRLAVLLKWKVVKYPSPEDPSIYIVEIIDTAIHELPTTLMAEPFSDKTDSLGAPLPLDPNDNFCVQCDLVLRPLTLEGPDMGEQPAGLRFFTNMKNVTIMLDNREYIYSVKTKDGGVLRADMTFQILEQRL